MNRLLQKYQLVIFVNLLLLFMISSCTKEEIIDVEETPDLILGPDIALQWNKFLLEIERFTPGYRPTVSSRTMGYIGITAYEAIIPGRSDQYRSIASQLPGLSIPEYTKGVEYNWALVLNSAYERAFQHFFEIAPTEQQAKLFSLANSIYDKIGISDPADVRQRSIAHGRNIANAVYQWSTEDEFGHQGYLKNTDPNYIPPSGTGLWQPTYPDYTAALTPQWGKVRTFVANEDDKCDPPLEYSENPNSQLYAQALETRNIVNRIRQGYNQEDLWIAEFWSDDCPIVTFTPAGRWIAIGNQVVEGHVDDVEKALYIYAKLGIALADAGIRSWAEKYRFNYLRPIDYIRNVMKDEEWNSVMCPDGSHHFTPPFPTYPSGHATFGGAASTVLTSIMGSNFDMTDRCHEGRQEFNGTPRSYNSFDEMSEENAYSRIPMGVHFRMDSDAGAKLGKQIGRKVSSEIDWIK